MESGKDSLWKAKYLLDIDDIDKQHQQYFSICSKIASLCDLARAGKKITIGQLLISIFELRSYAFKHFITEEALLAKYNYPKAFAHIELHDLYLEKIRSYTKQIKAHHKKTKVSADHDFVREAEKISKFAIGWWSKHILEDDKEYAEFIEKVGREQARDERHFGVKEE
ncbi:bacteriohemerythrin [Desulfovibrio sp. JC022]|uniref:bacteriohemerythrin n=1 Tax=Desulfovibrio sp. JC022 TaxID=2593642 RepID=UPI0013D28C8E|nr:hemerythrin domain-containing protein [Desulfovibrio sp. JC022]NDV24593.1 hypothetical protein [Desulfovibrio sp. JC022]